jgi:small subunit ribosomal protein S16
VLRIRLRRTGAKKQPRYRVVVAESSAPRDGAYVEVLGWYNPQAEPTQIHVDSAKAAEWIQRGAQPSERVANLLKRAAAASEPAAAQEATPAGARVRRTRSAAQEQPSADEAPESEGSAASTVSDTTEPNATDEPESEGSAGAPPA